MTGTSRVGRHQDTVDGFAVRWHLLAPVVLARLMRSPMLRPARP